MTQYLQGLGGVSGGNDAVAHLALDEQGRGLVAGVAQRTEVTIRAHAVGTAGAGIGIGQGSELEVYVVHEVNLLQRVAEGQSHGRPGRRYVLETGGGGQSGGSLELLDQLPAVQGIEEVDVAGAAVDDRDGQFPLLHIDAGRLLVRIASVLECVFFHDSVV